MNDMATPDEAAASHPDNPSDRRRVTVRDIAQKLGVSHVTVSYALRGLPRVSASMREKICREAERMGYRPDPMLQALSSYRRLGRPPAIQAALAWLCCWDPPEEMHTRKEFHAYWQGAKETAEKNGYRLEQFTPSPNMSLARIQQILIARGIRGVLVPPPQSTFSGSLAALDWRDFAIVKFGHAFADLKVNLVTSAHVYNAILAFSMMTARGYKRIGFVTSDYLMKRTHFPSGFLRAQYDVPESSRVPILALSEQDVVGKKSEALGAWLKRERPDAVLTNLREVPSMLRSLGLRIPRGIAVAGLSVHDGNVDSGIDQNPLEIGKAACETVMSQIMHGNLGTLSCSRELLIEGSWVDGASLPDRRASPVRKVRKAKLTG